MSRARTRMCVYILLLLYFLWYVKFFAGSEVIIHIWHGLLPKKNVLSSVAMKFSSLIFPRVVFAMAQFV
jgi:hypothetical protein